MNWFSPLIKFDHSLFIYLNGFFPRDIFFNTVFITLSIAGSLGIIWVVIALYLAFSYPKKNKPVALRVILANLISLIIIEIFIKPLVKRLRPEFTIQHINVLFDPLATYSFPSSHTAFAFASAYILSKTFPKQRILWYILAVLIGFSRIYLGKHYPSDVLAGAILGIVIGWIILSFPRRRESSLSRKNTSSHNKTYLLKNGSRVKPGMTRKA